MAHIRGVVKTSGQLAKRYGLSVERARLAAWFHDCAKEKKRSWMREVLEDSPFRLDGEEKKTPALWHPHAGAAVALRDWGLRDPAVLEAIRRHTLGAPGMGPLAQVVFVADFIEPSRKFPGVELARKAARKNLGTAVRLKAAMTLEFLLHKDLRIHPRLLETWNYYRSKESHG